MPTKFKGRYLMLVCLLVSANNLPVKYNFIYLKCTKILGRDTVNVLSVSY